MKRLFLILAAAVITASVFAQSPEKLSYQAVVRDLNQHLIQNQAIGMQISILQGSVSGTAVYIETHATSTNINGLVSIEIGGGTILSGDFTSIDWGDGPYFLLTETDPDGGTNYTISGTSQLLSVSYALHAKIAEEVSGPLNETDPVFGASTAAGITETDTAYWNQHTIDTHIDSTGIAALGYVAGSQNIDDVLSEGNDAGAKGLVNLGQLTIGSATTTTAVALEINSTTGALLLPRMTSAERDLLSPVTGMMIYNTHLNKFQGYATGDHAIITQTDTSSNAIPRSIVSGLWIMYQSFTAPSNIDITSVILLTDLTANNNGQFSILNGDGQGGTSLYTESIVYSGCGSGICETTIILATPFSITSGQTYTLKFEATSGGFSTFTNGNNPYPGGQVYQSGNSIPNEDMYFILKGSGFGWIDLH